MDIVFPLLIAFVCGFVVCLGILFFWRPKGKKNRFFSLLSKKFKGADSPKIDYQREVFSSLNIGLIVFDKNTKTVFCNKFALDLLQLPSVPATLTDFLTYFGSISGVKSLFFLPDSQRSITFQLGEIWINLSVKIKYVDNKVMSTTVIINDYTQQELQNRQRKEFVANVSHELKTPITTIKAYTESLLDWGLAEKQSSQIKNDIEKIRDDALRMEALVGDLLLLSSIDSNRRLPAVELIEIEPLVKNLIERLSLQAQARDININCYVLNKLPLIFAEAESLERAIGNLVINAIKYGVKGGKVDIYLSCLIDDLTIKVSDDGIGIAQEHLPFIFNRFYRVDTTGARLHGGTGLGLSIVQELIKMHHGEILVQSVLGSGTEFTIVLPSEYNMYQELIHNAKELEYSEDPWYLAAKKELLLQAKDFGMEATKISDLTDADLKIIMEQ